MSEMVRKLGEGDVLEDGVGEGSHGGKRENTVSGERQRCVQSQSGRL
jgi:hypothetical protein